jgi:hypothetical protein
MREACRCCWCARSSRCGSSRCYLMLPAQLLAVVWAWCCLAGCCLQHLVALSGGFGALAARRFCCAPHLSYCTPWPRARQRAGCLIPAAPPEAGWDARRGAARCLVQLVLHALSRCAAACPSLLAPLRHA